MRQQRSTTSPLQGTTSCAIAVLQLPFHFLRSVEPKVSRIKVNGDQVTLSVLAALELLRTAFYQTLVLKGGGGRKKKKKDIIGKGKRCQLGTWVPSPNGQSLRVPAHTVHTNHKLRAGHGDSPCFASRPLSGRASRATPRCEYPRDAPTERSACRTSRRSCAARCSGARSPPVYQRPGSTQRCGN